MVKRKFTPPDQLSSSAAIHRGRFSTRGRANNWRRYNSPIRDPKTWLRALALLGTVGLPSVLYALPSTAKTSVACNDAALPAPVNDSLKAKFPQWRAKQIADMDADDQQLWRKAHEKECPGIAIGHFKSAKELSYAVLLVPQLDSTGGYRIVMFSKGPSSDAYSWKLLDHADGETYSGLVISKAKPGKYSDFEGSKSIQTKLDGLYVEWMEKAAVLYYWSVGRYHSLQVTD